MNNQLSIVNSQLTITLSLGGFCLFLIGLAYRLPKVKRWDIGVFRLTHKTLQHYASFFRFLWPLGTTPVTVVLLTMCFIPNWQTGLTAALIYAVFSVVEPTIKRRLGRPRPFIEVPTLEMEQPQRPDDPSHPSGDSMRAWYLAFVLPAAFALPWETTLATCLIATLLSLGRIVLGVHYPLDVIGGSGLGLLASGIVLTSYQYLIFG